MKARLVLRGRPQDSNNYVNTFLYENSIFHAWPKCTLRKVWLVVCLSLNSIFILSYKQFLGYMLQHGLDVA